VRRLIVNADDFGLTPGVNRAILEAHEHGIVTSSTLMANSAALDDAVRLAQSHTRLAVGCHTMLVDGMPLLASGQVATLLSDPRSGEFLRGIGGFALRALSGRIDTDQVESEVTAQIHKLQSAGIAVSHLDTHKHTHLFPQILRPLLRAARACGVKAIRNPFGRIAFSAIAGRPNLWKRYGQLRVLNALAAKFRRAVAEAGMVTTDGSIGVAATGALDERLFRWLFENLPEGTWEFVCHPGYNDADLDKIHTRLRQSREIELRLLTSPTTREILAQNQVELISFRDLR
jgi:chitin disaccharide deacetylase